MNILLTGFEKFLSHSVNPSQLIVQELNGLERDDHLIRGETLPLHFHKIGPMISSLIDELQPTLLLMFGLAPRPSINIEKVAINYANSYGTPYNCGTITSGSRLVPGGPPAYFSTLPILKILGELRSAQIPARESLSAGAYGCNQVFYEAMHHLERKGMSIPAGFIHVPPLPEQCLDGRSASLPLDIQVDAAKKIIDVCLSSLPEGA